MHVHAVFAPISCCFWNVLCMVAARPLRSEQVRMAQTVAASWYDNYCLFFSIHSPAHSIPISLVSLVRPIRNFINSPLKIILHVRLFARAHVWQHARRDVCKCFSFIFYFVQSNWFFTISNRFYASFVLGCFGAKRVCFCCLIVVVRACNRIGENKCNGPVDVVDIARLSPSFFSSSFGRLLLGICNAFAGTYVCASARVTKHDRF